MQELAFLEQRNRHRVKMRDQMRMQNSALDTEEAVEQLTQAAGY